VGLCGREGFIHVPEQVLLPISSSSSKRAGTCRIRMISTFRIAAMIVAIDKVALSYQQLGIFP
jgi:hypothetical protein